MAKKKTFTVCFTVTTQADYEVEVQAKNEDEAEDLARCQYDAGKCETHNESETDWVVDSIEEVD